ncbi:helix-turn-helix transcriptional regulator [Chloroflexus sp.]|uniref:helix-turn-helix transcriptional regulator n=1 Tax=Chloroflexus sp. TaxID=1904827 RepID=UPI00298EF34D|nr:WYL domain-containing protein [Chloroflexus sp.]MDW8404833.1 WYL domain-containing protein [Chloroflexus sp.]
MRRKTEDRYTRLDAIESYIAQHPNGCTTQELANEFGVDPDTIRRDLALLESRGTGLIKQGRRYFIDHRRIVHTLKISNNEALALYLAARLLSRHSDEHNPYVVSALDRLSEALKLKVPFMADHIARAAMAVRERPSRPSYVSTLEVLTEAWATRRKVWIRYESQRAHENTGDLIDVITERTFAPYFLEPSSIGYACYVIGFDDLRKAIRTFKVERIREAKITSDPYTIPSTFDPYKELRSAWGIMWGEDEVEVVLHFAPRAARRLKESVWHISQRIEDNPDGSCIFTVRVSKVLEMKPWIRQWGAAVKVLAPDDLREEFAAEARALAKMYSDSGED